MSVCTHFLTKFLIYLFIKTIQKRKPETLLYHNNILTELTSALYSKVDRMTGSGYLTKLEDTQVDLKGNLKSSNSEAPFR